LSTLCENYFLSKTENLEIPKPSSSSMASSSSKQIISSSSANLQIKSKTMAIPSESLEVQIESPVEFASLNRNGMNLDALMAA